MTTDGLFPGPGGWLLAPEGAAIHRDERTAVLADIHLGYEWARGRGGDCVPAHSLHETLMRLERLLARAEIVRLVVAGDLVESRRPCWRTSNDVKRLRDWLENRGVQLVALAGNHDPPRRPALLPSYELSGWTIAHGHQAIEAKHVIFGHHHPTLRASGVNSPCFLIDDSTIVLPAFSRNAAGVSLSGLDRSLSRETLRCVASTGESLLDFGPVHALIQALAG